MVYETGEPFAFLMHGRIERFLNLCAGNNMSVLNCTTPANFFHALRRQMVRPFRKPLIIFTPKSLLRHPRCISQIQDLSNGSFSEIIDDAGANPLKVKRVLVCSGKLFYDLLEQKEKDQAEHIAIVRLEQLYPLPTDQFQKIKQR